MKAPSMLAFGSVLVTVLAACASQGPAIEPESQAAQVTTAQTAISTAAAQCSPSSRMPTEGRASAYDSTTVRVDGAEVKVCYGRPSARGRTMIGGDAVPYGRLWRTGANEPTILHTPAPVEVAGIPLEPGSYSLYTIPGETEWTVILNRSTSQWGVEGQYNEEVQAQEVARATVPSERTTDHVETFTIRSEPARNGADLLLEWEHARVRIPVIARNP